VWWRVPVRVKGRATQSANFPNKREAKDWAESLKRAIREARDHPAVTEEHSEALQPEPVVRTPAPATSVLRRQVLRRAAPIHADLAFATATYSCVAFALRSLRRRSSALRRPASGSYSASAGTLGFGATRTGPAA
jgi:hypothetical protein